MKGLPPRQRLSGHVNVPTDAKTRLLTVFRRALRKHCSYCGGGSIFKNWFDLKETCPTCGTLFEREHGYFLGAYTINLVVAEFLAFPNRRHLALVAPIGADTTNRKCCTRRWHPSVFLPLVPLPLDGP